MDTEIVVLVDGGGESPGGLFYYERVRGSWTKRVR